MAMLRAYALVELSKHKVMESQSTTIWVAVIFVATAVVSFFINTIRDKRNRDFDAVEREKQAALIKGELAEAAKVAKEDREEIALKVEDALHRQQAETNIHLSEQATLVEEVIKRQEVATRPDVNSGTAKIMGAIEVVHEKADAAYHEANTINKKLTKMSESGLIQLSKDQITDVEEIKKPEK